MNEQCVVNFGSGSFDRGEKRIRASFLEHGYDGDFLFFHHEDELSCPAHQEVPYAFKAYALKDAQRRGYRYVLWVDSSVYAVGPVEKAFGIIKNLGYLLLLNGWTTGQWCSDAALETLGLTREEAFEYRHIMACVMGLDLMDSSAQYFLEQYYALANDGITFKGAWSNKNHEVSQDDRVLGHRHDQTAASVIASKLGMNKWQEYMLVYNDHQDPNIKRYENTVFELSHL